MYQNISYIPTLALANWFDQGHTTTTHTHTPVFRSFQKYSIRRLIKDVKKWTSRKHGTVGYRLTQWLTGHGSFGAYRRKIGKSETATCYHCDRGQDDTAEHTLFRCPARLAARDRVERKLRRIIHMDNIVDVMLEGEEQWKTISEWIEGIMKEKEEEEWRREGRRL
ncbi:hypothetical protein NQ315_014726 [Exocentrus adspersus]|uniref:Reverse transcriptase n=1 Tax=Exocentrus adspersus TaxID=1586481 RepID=A0AAV8VDL9_9CUCU|nr:hypothetical protein NQ315_014726 [Exocentrus adspersus]